MVYHNIKIPKNFADDVEAGRMTFFVHHRGGFSWVYSIGDIVEFMPVGTDNKLTGSHPIIGKLYEITYVLENCYGLEKGWCVIGIKQRGK